MTKLGSIGIVTQHNFTNWFWRSDSIVVNDSDNKVNFLQISQTFFENLKKIQVFKKN